MRPRLALIVALLTPTACGLGTVMYGDNGSALSSVWQPRPGTSWQIQFGSGAIDTSIDVDAFDVDLFDSTTAIKAARSRGKRAICYFSAGSHEDWRKDASLFPPEALGKALDGWPGERWVDIRSQAVRDIMVARLDYAASLHCDAVDPDNVNGYSNDTGFPLTAADQLAFNKFLADAAHERKLAIGLKNDLDQIPELVESFDFAINESCFVYSECQKLSPFVTAGKAVFQIEYGANARAQEICPLANALDFDSLVKDVRLGPTRIPCR